MAKGFLLKKLDMVQQFDPKGRLVAATLCKAAPCFVVGIKSKEKDGYAAFQLGSGLKKNMVKPLVGQLKKAGLTFKPEIIREVRVKDEKDLPQSGKQISLDQVFSVGDLLYVVGVTKGRGFSGVIKRWGFHSQPATHGGQKNRQRSTGAIGAQTPGKVVKGKKMPGHYGVAKKTVKNLEVLSVNTKEESLLIKGALPGYRGSWLLALPIGKAKGFVPLTEQENENEEK
ncbi:MAG: 50S ribosomal protein L3 [Patescibacteria group bacterium]|nr:50S ribosomal protein L3 [Patescibacteria group bacterium]